jgi:hypothetical protein
MKFPKEQYIVKRNEAYDNERYGTEFEEHWKTVQSIETDY